MNEYINKLIDLGTPPLCIERPVLPESLIELLGPLLNEMLGMLKHKNGFYAFESSLHVFPSKTCGSEIGLINWNKGDVWISHFKGLADNCLYFAEDIFGCQFCIKQREIFSFDPETAEFSYLASNLEDWAKAILTDYSMLTGYTLAHDWQAKNGRIKEGFRLIPKVPFLVGGEYSVDNLYEMESIKSMRYRAELALQIKDLPDGSQIKIKIDT